MEGKVQVPAKKYRHRRKKRVPFDEEQEFRTIFVGNLPNSWNKHRIIHLFSKYGTVETVRFRCAPLADPRVPKKVAVITKNFHPARTSIHGFVRFADKKSAIYALQANGTVVGDHHIRVNLATSNASVDQDYRKAIFVGNVPFSAEDEDLWRLFGNCGAIQSIRVLRDSKTGVGKGFAYVNFKTRDAVELALKMDGEKLNDRDLRINRCKSIKKNKSMVKKEKLHKKINKKMMTKFGKGTHKTVDEKVTHDDQTVEETKPFKRKRTFSGTEEAKFQEQTVSEAKKQRKRTYPKDEKENIHQDIGIKNNNKQGKGIQKTNRKKVTDGQKIEEIKPIGCKISFPGTKEATFQGQTISRAKKLKKVKKVSKDQLRKKMLIKKLGGQDKMK